MRISILTFGAIASVLSTAAYADPVTVTTQDYVDTQDALKQDLIEPYEFPGDNPGIYTGVVTANEDGVSDGMGILTLNALEHMGDVWWHGQSDLPAKEFLNLGSEENYDVYDTIPTTLAVYSALDAIRRDLTKRKIPGVGRYVDNYGIEREIREEFPSSNEGRLSSVIKGSALVAKTDNCRDADWLFSSGAASAQTCGSGERLIFEESSATGHGSTYTELEKIQIPTVGAMMTAISANTPSLPTGTANSIVMYNASGNIGGSRTIATSVGTSTSATTIPTTGAVVTGLNTKQDKMTCTQWLGDEHTDANCLLWSIAN